MLLSYHNQNLLSSPRHCRIKTSYVYEVETLLGKEANNLEKILTDLIWSRKMKMLENHGFDIDLIEGRGHDDVEVPAFCINNQGVEF